MAHAAFQGAERLVTSCAPSLCLSRVPASKWGVCGGAGLWVAGGGWVQVVVAYVARFKSLKP